MFITYIPELVLVGSDKRFIFFTIRLYQPGNNLTGVVVQFATQDQQNATHVQKCIAVFAMLLE